METETAKPTKPKGALKKAIENYQCPGCVGGMDVNCGAYKKQDFASGCGGHVPGTMIMPHPGKIMLGMPRGFDRMGPDTNLRPQIFENLNEVNGWQARQRIPSNDSKTFYDKFNVPVWKHKNEEGHILVRGFHPRQNRGFLHIILDGNDYDKINCAEVTAQEISEMD